ncbi:NAD-dependent epimerase/dehydratase family protein [Clostridium hydrogeniformans]|uniref:NAD-dependent epimerase/dehydratase family protein n=1 Tax=Clostridium hydrogeniformans TaxID=349933 RepID=UPI000486F4DF|nr:NAD-dependent epimerase/dehydratase family protein [Clostridium hydrogeniformans]
MKILVTGGAGFIGSNIVDGFIENGHDVVVVDNLSHGKRGNLNSKVKFYNLDIRDKELNKIFESERPEVVCHHAAQISVPKSVDNPIEDADINIIGSLNLLECCRLYGVKKVIYPASAAIFGEPIYLPIDENHPLDMMSGYGVTKHTLEHYLKVYKELYNINYTVMRYANVYGPRQDSTGEGGVVAIFCEKILENEVPTIFGNGEQTRDFVFVKDVVEANIKALTELDNEIYNVATNTKISIDDLFNMVCNILNKDMKPVYGEERAGDIRHSYMTYKKINEACGWKPQYSLENGIKETINYYIEKGHK